MSRMNRPIDLEEGRLGLLGSNGFRASWMLFMSLALSLALATASLAQRDRTDPGTPPDPSGGSGEGWQVLSIPGLPAGAEFCDVWSSAQGVVYVWSYLPPWLNGAGLVDEAGEGERLPDHTRVPLLGTSTLYRFDGTQWTVALRASGQDCVALYGTDTGQMYASTVNGAGEAQLYSYDGTAWSVIPTPGPIRGTQHTFAGVPGDLYFRVDRTILHFDGSALTVDYTLPAYEPPVRGLVYLGADLLFAMGTQGHYLKSHGTWSEAPADFTLGDVEDAWGMRDPDGFLHMFAVGSDAARCGVKLWSFREDDLVTHAGAWLPVLADPVSGAPGLGFGMHLWGITGNEAYATGVVDGEGRMLRFDGSRWTTLVPPVGVGAIHGVWGTSSGVVWFSTESGSIVRFQRANRAPDLAAVRPSVERLWPSDLALVPLHLTGIVDPDGDAVKVEITRITQDEPLVTDGNLAACPDATVSDNLIRLRAEHLSNGDGRTYEIEFTATDRLGAMSRGITHVCVPHYSEGECGPDPTMFDAMGACGSVSATGSLEAQVFSGALQVRYELAEVTPVHLGIYDVGGRLRTSLATGVQAPGAHEAHWNLDRLEPGVYFVKLRTAMGPAMVRRLIVMR